MSDPAGFVGAKIALLCPGGLVTYLRDDKPGLPWAGCWDLPGGAREASETAEQCLFREVEEEFGLTLGPTHMLWRGVFPAMLWPDRPALFFVGRITADEVAAIHFGDEGQTWQVMPVSDWLGHDRAVPEMQNRTRVELEALGLVGA